MSLTVHKHLMTSTVTSHVASGDDADGWGVSWAPGRRLDRNQAVSAMTVAELVESGASEGTRDWSVVRSLAAELGMTATQAAAMILKTEA